MSFQQPAKYDITIYKGSYFKREFQLKSGNPLVPIDLTGNTVRAQIRSSYDVSPKLADFTINVASDLANGKIIVELYADDSALIAPMKAVWDLEIVPPEGEHYAWRAIMGGVTFSKEVTKDIP